jgi:hypothetical protein
MRLALALALMTVMSCNSDSSNAPLDLSTVDGAASDQSAAPDLAAADFASASVDGSLPPTCSTSTGADACNPETQYCYVCICGAPPHHNPWSDDASSCRSFPSACAATPTCACLLANNPLPCTCITVNGQALLTCMGP